ncbi:hypothetical protein BCR34DRAFT_242281 [Clohesyomyces aquaticus]|uniref:Uncharacterized protein n=1 Tax=Clohesyomyces aquaticus TaxID=1231657 RepID=A0A1Y1ZVV1_9PLEO|nr:hypothetical protein BCR34DRAFT_242281 [Clohesyomyces aquaticus]
MFLARVSRRVYVRTIHPRLLTVFFPCLWLSPTCYEKSCVPCNPEIPTRHLRNISTQACLVSPGFRLYSFARTSGKLPSFLLGFSVFILG